MAKILNRIDKNLINRMAKASFWSFTGTAIAKLLSLLAGIVCANIMSKEQYGQLGIVRSTLNMFIVFGSAGLGVTATRYISFYLKNEKEKIKKIYHDSSLISICTGLVLSIAILVLADKIAINYLDDVKLTHSIQIGALLLFFTVLNGVQNGALMGFEDFKHISQNNLFGGIFEFIFMVAGAYYWGVEGAILGFGTGFIIIYLFNVKSIRYNFKKHGISNETSKPKDTGIDKNLYIRYTIPAALSAITIAPTYWIIRTILVKEAGYEELAIYEAADQWKIIILYIPMAISQIALPILSSIIKDQKSYIDTLILNTTVVGTISLLFVLLTILFSPYYILLYGPGYSNIAPLKILAWSTIFSSTANVLEMMLYSYERIWTCLGVNIAWGGITIGLAYVFTHQQGLGASGLSYAILLSYVFSFSAFALISVATLKKAASKTT